MSEWHVERWDGDDGALRDWYDVFCEAAAHDVPDLPSDLWEEFRLAAHQPRDDEAREWLFARDPHGALVGGADLHLPLADNTDLVELDLVVHPVRRREGVGSTLLQAARHRAREHGRTRLVCFVGAAVGTVAPGDGFATVHGGTSAHGEVRRMLELADFSADAVAVPVPEGYALVQWSVRPDPSLLDELADLRARMSVDEPMGKLDWEPERWDAARVDAHYALAAERGRLVVSSAVRHVDSAHLVGWTDLEVSREAPENAWQGDLLVTGPHRGKRLGTVLKVENLRALQRESPATRRVHTWNAPENSYMIGINEAVGFCAREQWTSWVIPA